MAITSTFFSGSDLKTPVTRTPWITGQTLPWNMGIEFICRLSCWEIPKTRKGELTAKDILKETGEGRLYYWEEGRSTHCRRKFSFHLTWKSIRDLCHLIQQQPNKARLFCTIFQLNNWVRNRVIFKECGSNYYDQRQSNFKFQAESKFLKYLHLLKVNVL